jgi:hypothetical protein
MVAQLNFGPIAESLFRPVEHRRRRIKSYYFSVWKTSADQGQEPSVAGAEVNAPLDLLREDCQQHLLRDLPMRYLPREVISNPRLIGPLARHATNAIRPAEFVRALVVRPLW